MDVVCLMQAEPAEKLKDSTEKLLVSEIKIWLVLVSDRIRMNVEEGLSGNGIATN